MLDGWTPIATVGGGLLQLIAQADPSAPGAAAAAAAQGASKAPGMGVMVEQLLIFGGIFLVFWFLVLRPQSKRQKEHQAFLSTLKVGTKVVTSSGIFGRIVELDDKVVQLEIAPKVTIKVLRSQVAGVEGKAAEAVESANAR
jgi:preprotein translocase subunit YajC